MPGKSEIFSAGIENFYDGIHDPQTSNQIYAAACKCNWKKLIEAL